MSKVTKKFYFELIQLPIDSSENFFNKTSSKKYIVPGKINDLVLDNFLNSKKRNFKKCLDKYILEKEIEKLSNKKICLTNLCKDFNTKKKSSQISFKKPIEIKLKDDETKRNNFRKRNRNTNFYEFVFEKTINFTFTEKSEKEKFEFVENRKIIEELHYFKHFLEHKTIIYSTNKNEKIQHWCLKNANLLKTLNLNFILESSKFEIQNNSSIIENIQILL